MSAAGAAYSYPLVVRHLSSASVMVAVLGLIIAVFSQTTAAKTTHAHDFQFFLPITFCVRNFNKTLFSEELGADETRAPTPSPTDATVPEPTEDMYANETQEEVYGPGTHTTAFLLAFEQELEQSYLALTSSASSSESDRDREVDVVLWALMLNVRYGHWWDPWDMHPQFNVRDVRDEDHAARCPAPQKTLSALVYAWGAEDGAALWDISQNDTQFAALTTANLRALFDPWHPALELYVLDPQAIPLRSVTAPVGVSVAASMSNVLLLLLLCAVLALAVLAWSFNVLDCCRCRSCRCCACYAVGGDGDGIGAMAGCCCRCRPIDNGDWAAILIFCLRVLNLYADMGALLSVVASPTVFIALGFFLMSYVFNLAMIGRAAREVGAQNARGSQWFSDCGSFAFFVVLVVLSGGCYPALRLCSSAIFGMTIFSSGLFRAEVNRMEFVQLWGIAVLENIPQIGCQILLITYMGFATVPVLHALAISLLSLVVSLLSYWHHRWQAKGWSASTTKYFNIHFRKKSGRMSVEQTEWLYERVGQRQALTAELAAIGLTDLEIGFVNLRSDGCVIQAQQRVANHEHEHEHAQQQDEEEENENAYQQVFSTYKRPVAEVLFALWGINEEQHSQFDVSFHARFPRNGGGSGGGNAGSEEILFRGNLTENTTSAF